MSEETNQPATQNINAGGESETDSPIDRANSIIKRLEEAEKRLDEKTRGYEKILARQMLSGRSNAGSVQKTPEQLKQERIDEEVKKIVSQFRR